jgi:large subunit ribosomal protein L10
MSKSAIQIKQKEVAELVTLLKSMQSLVVVDDRGIPVHDDTAMRADLRAAGVQYKVVKNNIMQRALDIAGLSLPEGTLTGPSAFAFCQTDAVSGAKILADRQKDKKVVIKAGIVEGKVLDAKAMAAVAAIPPKPILIAQLLGLLLSPLSSLAVALSEIAKKKEAA